MASAGCTPQRPADKSEAEPPAPAHCAPLTGDPLPPTCGPAARSASAHAPRAGNVPGRAPRTGRDGDVPVPDPARNDVVPAPAGRDRNTSGDEPGHEVGDGGEPVSPELMPEAPFSGWSVPGPWLPEPEPGPWQGTDHTDGTPAVLEHGTAPDAPAALPSLPAGAPVALEHAPAPHVPAERPILPGGSPVTTDEKPAAPVADGEGPLLAEGRPATLGDRVDFGARPVIGHRPAAAEPGSPAPRERGEARNGTHGAGLTAEAALDA